MRKNLHPNILAIIILLAIPISGLTIDINVPSLPAIASYFHVDKSWAQLTVTSYMTGFILGQFFVGPISDSWGRKRPFIIGATIYAIVSFLATHATSVHELLLLRFFQGTSVCFIIVPARAVISDMYQGREFEKMVAYMAMAWSIGPIVAPAIGGYLQAYFDWHGPFYFLGFYALLMIILNMLYVPETLKEIKSLRLKEAFSNYGQLLSSKPYLLTVTCIGLLYSSIVLFGLVGPFLIQQKLGYTPIEFGRMALLMGVALFAGNITSRLLMNYSNTIKIRVCFSLLLLNAVTMLVLSFVVGINIYNIVTPVFIALYLGGIIYPVYYSRCLAIFPQMGASANAMMIGLNLLLTVGISVIGALTKSDTQVPFALLYVGIAVGLLLVHYCETKIEAHETTS